MSLPMPKCCMCFTMSRCHAVRCASMLRLQTNSPRSLKAAIASCILSLQQPKQSSLCAVGLWFARPCAHSQKGTTRCQSHAVLGIYSDLQIIAVETCSFATLARASESKGTLAVLIPSVSPCQSQIFLGERPFVDRTPSCPGSSTVLSRIPQRPRRASSTAGQQGNRNLLLP